MVLFCDNGERMALDGGDEERDPDDKHLDMLLLMALDDDDDDDGGAEDRTLSVTGDEEDTEHLERG